MQAELRGGPQDGAIVVFHMFIELPRYVWTPTTPTKCSQAVWAVAPSDSVTAMYILAEDVYVFAGWHG